MTVKFFPQSTFVRRYLVVMSVLTLAMLFLAMALLSARRVQSESAAGNGTSPEGAEALPVLGTVKGFTLTDQTGASFSTDRLRGRIYVADFIFTSCSGICPTLTAAMAQLHHEFADESRVQFVSISVDPETDTPEVLAWYANRFDADAARWHFLTGPMDTINGIARDQFQLGSGGGPLNHSGRFALVDGSGQIRGYYYGTEPTSVAALRLDLRRLLTTS